ESLNANELKMLLHMKAINQVEDKVEKADLIILDQFSTEKSIKKYYEKLGNSSFELKQFKTKMKLVEKGETEHVAVAAASILAREYLLKYMDRQNTKWNTTFPLGTNPIVENFTREFIAEHGKDKLNEIAKVSFKTTQKII
ncbi:MAG: ribonuclease HIII, partial [Mycoplasmataceae bacterium]|nr:ribonuclease HIII [Mycoplasmataceae bacterium]